MSNRGELPDLVDILSGLGRYHEAGLVSYKHALATSNGSSADSRIQRLKGVLCSPLFHGHSDQNHVIGDNGRPQIVWDCVLFECHLHAV